MIITFCGHSNYKGSADDEEKILSFLSEKIGNAHAALYLGGYGNFDSFAAACGKKYQANHPNTKLIYVTPYVTVNTQTDLYDSIIYPGLENVPPRFAISRRNKWMVDKADFVIAYIRHSWGGAFQSYTYARRAKKQIFNLCDIETQKNA